MPYTLENQMELEQYYKNYAEQILTARNDKARQEEDYVRTGVGKGIMKHLLTTFVSNIEKSVEYSLTAKKGVKPAYYEILKRYSKFYEGDDRQKFYLTIATEVMKEVINNMMIKKYILSDIALKIGV